MLHPPFLQELVIPTKKKVKRAIYQDFYRTTYTSNFPYPVINPVHSHGSVEIMRGCPNGCRFCHAGYFYRPQRSKFPSIIKKEVEDLIIKKGYTEITLSSLSSGDYPDIIGLFNDLTALWSKYNVSFQLPSLKVDSFTLPLIEKDVCKGFVGFDAVNQQHTFTEVETTLLHLFSELLVNVSQRKNAQEALTNERGFLKTLIQAIPDLVWLKDTNGIYLACNQRFEDFFGAKESDIIGKSDYDFVDKSLADFFRNHDQKVMQSGKANINEEELLFVSDGHKEILQTTKVPIYDAKKNLIGVLGVGRDITQLKLAQKEVETKEH